MKSTIKPETEEPKSNLKCRISPVLLGRHASNTVSITEFYNICHAFYLKRISSGLVTSKFGVNNQVFLIYFRHTGDYKKYKKENSDNGSAQINSPGVPMYGIEIRDPKAQGETNYGMSADEDVDTGVASNDSDMQDVSLGSESNYRYPGDPYAESLRSESVYPNGNNDSGMYPSDPESNSFGAPDAAGASGEASGGASVEAGTSTEQAANDSTKKPDDANKKDKDFIDDIVDSAKEKLDNCTVQ